MEDNTAKPQWGYGSPPNGTKLAWGGRAIYTLRSWMNPYFKNGKKRKNPKREEIVDLDIPYDRISMVSDSDFVEHKAFTTWINKKGIPWIKDECVKRGFSGSETAVIEWIDSSNGYAIKASPKASYGYLYITAWKVPVIEARTVTVGGVVVGGFGDVG